MSVEIRLNLGCGEVKLPGYINIDNNPLMNPDLLHDLTKPLPFEDNSVDEVRAFDFLEHIPAGQPVVNLIEEVYRVLKPEGLFESRTPDAEYGQAAFQDPYHVSFWVENSWWYYSDPLLRNLYNIKADFHLECVVRDPPLAPGSRMHWLHVRAIARKGA